MRYLTLSADYLAPSIRDETLGRVDVRDIGMSDDLTARIVAWNEAYQVVIPRGPDERAGMADLIERLDADGIELADEVQRELAPAKVRYYSEGWLRPR
jgi:hypothetical protein